MAATARLTIGGPTTNLLADGCAKCTRQEVHSRNNPPTSEKMLLQYTRSAHKQRYIPANGCTWVHVYTWAGTATRAHVDREQVDGQRGHPQPRGRLPMRVQAPVICVLGWMGINVQPGSRAGSVAVGLTAHTTVVLGQGSPITAATLRLQGVRGRGKGTCACVVDQRTSKSSCSTVWCMHAKMRPYQH